VHLVGAPAAADAAEPPLFAPLFAPANKNRRRWTVPGDGAGAGAAFYAQFPSPPTRYAWLGACGVTTAAVDLRRPTACVRTFLFFFSLSRSEFCRANHALGSGGDGVQTVLAEDPYLWRVPGGSGGAGSGEAPAVGVALTEFHALLVYADRVEALCLVNRKVTFVEPFPMQATRPLLGVTVDPVMDTVFAYSPRTVFLVRLKSFPPMGGAASPSLTLTAALTYRRWPPPTRRGTCGACTSRKSSLTTPSSFAPCVEYVLYLFILLTRPAYASRATRRTQTRC
jgi:hypothetical protein